MSGYLPARSVTCLSTAVIGFRKLPDRILSAFFGGSVHVNQQQAKSDDSISRSCGLESLAGRLDPKWLLMAVASFTVGQRLF
jgi:hypothetical protein